MIKVNNMKKVYQVGAHAPVRTYKEALRQHAKLRVVHTLKYGSNQLVAASSTV